MECSAQQALGRTKHSDGSSAGAMSTPKWSLEAGVVLGVVLDGAEGDPVGVAHRRAALDRCSAPPQLIA